MDEKYASDAQSTLKNQQYLSVTCNGIPAVLNRGRLGSGGKGRCIEYNDELLTPNEFQARCGKASSKDWKRSIRYHGRPISRLIDQKVLTCHAISCICAACSDDANVQSPVRYFKKWNRKRRAQTFPSVAEISQGMPTQCKRPGRLTRVAANNNSDESVDTEGAFRPLTGVLCADPGCMGISKDVLEAHKSKQQGVAGGGQPCKVEKSQPDGSAQAMIPPLSNLHNEIVNDIVNEQKCWWHLETVAESILRDAITLKTLVSRTKETSMASKANILVQLRNAIAPSSVSLPPQLLNHQLNAADESGRHDMLLRIMAMARTMPSQRRGMDAVADSLRTVDDHQQYCIIEQQRGAAPPQHAFSFGAIAAKGAALRHVMPTVLPGGHMVSPGHHYDEAMKRGGGGDRNSRDARGECCSDDNRHSISPLKLVVNERSSGEGESGDKDHTTDHSSVDGERPATTSPTAAS